MRLTGSTWPFCRPGSVVRVVEWEQRVADLWASFDDHSEDEFLARMEALVAELPADSARGAFERASAFDSTGHPDQAVPLYRRALELGLDGGLRRQAVIQLASSLRNLGQSSESVELLRAERGRDAEELDDAVSAFLALALVDVGREREAVSVALEALTPHLSRYQRSLANYARLIAE
jgi:tetratricopeptide (TPR) repeat protein